MLDLYPRARVQIEHSQAQHRGHELYAEGDGREKRLLQMHRRLRNQQEHAEQYSRARQGDHESKLRLRGARHPSSHSPRNPGTHREATDDRSEQPGELGLAQMPVIDDDRGGGTDEAHHRGKVGSHGDRECQKLLVAHDSPGRARQLSCMQAHAPRLRVGLGQAQETAESECHSDGDHESEHGPPAQRHVDPPADDGRHGRSEREDHDHETHELLCLGALVQVADDRAADDRADACRHSLHNAKHEQSREVGRRGAA